jgi:hypothetical protein
MTPCTPSTRCVLVVPSYRIARRAGPAPPGRSGRSVPAGALGAPPPQGARAVSSALHSLCHEAPFLLYALRRFAGHCVTPSLDGLFALATKDMHPGHLR